MSMIWRSAMPLLTTLAALVIIVHCVEEDMETEYRHDLRPRILDTGTPSYDQPWRALEETPVQQSRHNGNWDESSPDDPPKRRRPGRKRKRRPQTNPDGDLEVQERFAYPDEPPRPYYDVDFENNRQTTEMPKRRRKKPDQRPIRWIDEDVVVVERPLRKKSGQRRKRPLLETWPASLTEFGNFANIKHDVLEGKAEVPEHGSVDISSETGPRDIIEDTVFGNDPELTEPRTSIVNEEQPLILPTIEEEDTELIKNTHTPDDKSVSEFSVELTNLRATKPNKEEIYDPKFREKESDPYKDNEKKEENDSPWFHRMSDIFLENYKTDTYMLETKEQVKGDEKVSTVIDDHKIRLYTEYNQALMKSKSRDKIALNFTAFEIFQDFDDFDESQPPDYWLDDVFMDIYPMDPLTLKDILKRSNGTSLSEILQQHNLSLTDLLNGKGHAVSILRSRESLEDKNRNREVRNDLSEKGVERKPVLKEESEEQLFINSETKYATEPVTEGFTTTQEHETIQANRKEAEAEPRTTAKPVEESVPRISTRRRYPTGLRKKLRMRPMLNVTNSYKGQLSRDLIALNARKYSQHRRNTTKSKEWKVVIQSMRSNNTQNDNNTTTTLEATTITIIPEETTTPIKIESDFNSMEDIRPQNDMDSKLDDINMDVTESSVVTEILTEIPKNVTEKPVSVVTMARPTAISSGLRRQAFNNRLKRKRLKQKNSSTEPPQDDLIKHLFGMGNLVSSSEFIARTQDPRTIKDSDEITTIEDVVTTEMTIKPKLKASTDGPLHIKIMTKKLTTPKSIIQSTTAESAKIEIEEIFNDTQTSEKLSRILMERNMTLNELVEHRERGSSHVHLADIFHNASREPNPPEPFLSKSLLEPISKETYPLRAILEANLHDPNSKVTTRDPSMINNINIPVVMDYRNNVNENAENMGIMSLFDNFTKNMTKSTLSPDFEENNHNVSDIASNVTNANETVRESRVLGDMQDDIVSWNEIFSLMGRNRNDTEELPSISPFKKITIEEDADGDGLIVLEDLQRLKDFDNIALGSNEKLTHAFEKKESNHEKGILDKIPSQTKSVTVATASIAGLAMILFLLTYAAFKWKQQRSMIKNKRTFCDERIPTPVFENRKGHKNNSSTRSISPMLQTSNIYTLNTLDSQNGKESPDYMWDSLRKPFQ